MRRADDIGRVLLKRLFQHLLHRFRELVEVHHIFDDRFRAGAIERLEVAEEVIRLSHIELRLLIQPAMHRIIGSLEQSVFAVRNKLVAAIRFDLAVQVLARHNDRRRDVVF